MNYDLSYNPYISTFYERPQDGQVQPYRPSRSEYERGYNAGKMTVAIATAGIGLALAYYFLKKINNNHD